MSNKEISIAFQTDKSPGEYIALARLVDRYDFDAVSVYCDAPFQPSYGPLLLMAPHIQRARLGPAAVSPFRIHPLDIAADTALLAGLSKGGVYIGLARGAWLAEHGIQEPARPIQGIREAIQIIRSLLSGTPVETDGKVFQVSKLVRAPYPIPQAKVPIMIGTWGARLAGLAGELAEEVKVGGSTNPALAPILMEAIRQGEERAKRSRGTVGLVMGAVTVVDEDAQLARRAAKEQVALYLPVVAGLDPTAGVEPELLQRIQLEVQQGRRQQAGALISDRLLETFAFAGDADDLVRQAQSLFAAGVQRVEFGTPHGLDPVEGINILGQQVLPRLREAF